MLPVTVVIDDGELIDVAFSQREGIALSTITYNDDGVIGPIFYRLSPAEMVVPYATPEHPTCASSSLMCEFPPLLHFLF